MDTKKDYLVSVIESGPQVIDAKKVFYIEDKNVIRTPRGKSVASVVVRSKVNNFSADKLDETLTAKVREREAFEKIMEDRMINNLLNYIHGVKLN